MQIVHGIWSYTLSDINAHFLRIIQGLLKVWHTVISSCKLMFFHRNICRLAPGDGRGADICILSPLFGAFFVKIIINLVRISWFLSQFIWGLNVVFGWAKHRVLLIRFCKNRFFYGMELGFRWNLMVFLLFKFQLRFGYFFHLNVFHFKICFLKFVNNLIGNALMLVSFRHQICINLHFRISTGLYLYITGFKRLVTRNLFLKILVQ